MFQRTCFRYCRKASFIFSFFTLVFLFATTSRADWNFIASRSFESGSLPHAVAIADFNGDSYPDLAVTDSYSNNVAILLGDGSGAFAAAVKYTTGTSPKSVAVGDLNSDSYPDLAVANTDSDNVSVLLGNGNGTFATALNFGAGDAPSSVAIDDLNGDSYPDLAVANTNSDNISVLLGAGDGTFFAAVNYSAGDGPRSVAIADLNGDSHPDLAVAAWAGVEIMLGDGSGTFSAAVNYSAGDGPFSIAIADLNDDNYPDLAVVNRFSGNVSVLPGNGDGTFAAAVNYSTGSRSYSVAIGDLNGDNFPDLAVANNNSTNVSVLLGDGSGAFGTAVNYNVGYGQNAVAIADLDGDSHPDLAVTEYADDVYYMTSVLVSVLKGNGDGTFTVATKYSAGNDPYSVTAADLNGDGFPDLAVANNYSDNVSVLLGNGDGSFAARVNYSAGDSPYAVAAADLDGDGYQDLAVANYNSDNVSVLLGAGNGTFSAAVNYSAGDGPRSVAIADLDGDSHPDLVVANSLSGNASVLLGVGDGTFATAVNYTTGTSSQSLAIADLNGDSFPDLVLTVDQVQGTIDYNVSVLLGIGDGTFATANYYIAGGGITLAVSIADLNGDSFPDLAVVCWTNNTVYVMPGNGTGAFPTAKNYYAGYGLFSIAIGDLNGDGYSDIAFSHYGAHNVSVRQGNGSGAFGPADNYDVDDNPRSVVIADFNGDNRPDLAVANQGSDNVSVLINRLPLCVAIPPAPTLTVPMGTTDQALPVYVWESNPCADAYKLYIQNQLQKNIFYQWYPADVVDNGDGTCSINPMRVLEPGDYYWIVRARNDYGESPISAKMPFTVDTTQVKPIAPTLTSPTGTVDQALPVYVWESIPSADAYKLYIQNQLQKNIFYQWYPADVVDNGDGTCSINPGRVLEPGDYYWIVRARNGYGEGPISAKMPFTVDTTQVKPIAPTLTSPTGTVDQALPVYVWESVPSADAYKLYIQNQFQKNIFYKWYAKDVVDNGDGTCSINPGRILEPGNYFWIVRARNDYGEGPISAKMPFTVQ